MNNILTVTQLNYQVRHLLESELGFIWLSGEVSNFSQPVSGHWYLTLKDEQAQVRCAMFKMKNQRVNFRPQNGMQVLVRANVSLYEPRGDYQLIIESMQPAGDGLLQQQFEQLKQKLAAQGLFAQQHKKPLPTFVKTLGIITSASGAALQDILQILQRRDPSLKVIIYPVLVQGKEAASDIAQTIALANQRNECEVLIVGRGGGSLEDLWCFNEESVAQAIFHSRLPIISAVGHETDVTIADFVADLRAPTPSAAAELVSRDQQELVRQFQHQFHKISLAFDRLWAEKCAQFEQLKLRLNAQHPARQLQYQRQQFSHLQVRLENALKQHLFVKNQQIKQLSHRLITQHPKRQLQRQQDHFFQIQQRLMRFIHQYLQHKQQKWQHTTQRVANNSLPHHVFKLKQQHETLTQRLHLAFEQQLAQKHAQFQQACLKLEGLSPLKILARGYSVTKFANIGAVISHSDQVKTGDLLETCLAQGRVLSEVVEVYTEYKIKAEFDISSNSAWCFSPIER